MNYFYKIENKFFKQVFISVRKIKAKLTQLNFDHMKFDFVLLVLYYLKLIMLFEIHSISNI